MTGYRIDRGGAERLGLLAVEMAAFWGAVSRRWSCRGGVRTADRGVWGRCGAPRKRGGFRRRFVTGGSELVYEAEADVKFAWGLCYRQIFHGAVNSPGGAGSRTGSVADRGER